MEKIVRHIEVLIRRHDYVIVPDLGGFVFQKQSSVIYSDLITPPLTVTSFNPLMKVSDGLLAIEIARTENVSFREAMQIINSQVAALKSLLENGKSVDFGSLGQLCVDDDKKLIFKPSLNDNFIPSNFGLNTLHYSVAKVEAKKEEKKEIRIVLPPVSKIAKYAAVAVVVAGIFFTTPKLSENYQNLGNLNPFSKLDQNEEIQTPTLKSAPTVHIEKISEVAPTSTVELNHHVIVSCMTTREEADEYCEWLKAQNFSKAHILNPIKTYRIAIQSFETKQEAVTFMMNLRDTKSQFADAWVLSE